MRRDAETSTKHALIGSHVSNFVDGYLSVGFGVSRNQANIDFFFNAVANVVQWSRSVDLGCKTVHVYHRQPGICMWRKELLLAMIDSAKVVQKLNG